jgi:ribosomal protein S18 acetylase RimI-like enzyme
VKYTSIIALEALHIKVATPDDLSALATLRYQWRAGERGEVGLTLSEFTGAFRHWMELHAASHVPFLVTEGAEPIAMGWLAIVDRVPGPQYAKRRSGYLQSIYVAEPQRSRSVGTALVEFMIDHARGLGLEYLAVHPSDASFSLYRRFGFTESQKVLELRWGLGAS